MTVCQESRAPGAGRGPDSALKRRMEVCDSSHGSAVASCLLTNDPAPPSSPATRSPPPPPQSAGPRNRSHSFSLSMSWSQQQKPLLHIHLMFVILITASIWTYCAADVPSSSGPEATSVIAGPTAGGQQPPPQYRSSFSWSSSPYPSDNCDRESCNEASAYEAIRWIHRQLDDDANGDIDIEETDEFLRDDLKLENGKDRQKAFHRTDGHISVDDLWRSWKESQVHNWTSDDVLEWLAHDVELPKYTRNFFINEINGSYLPRLASSPQYLQNVLRIKDPIHRQKIALKAMDVVLFGPSNDHRSRRYKDAVLVTSLLLAVGGCWYAFIQKKSSQLQIRKMIRDMESLSKAENQLQAMQDELSKARNEQEGLLTEKERLEERLKSELEKMNSESGGSQQLGSVSSLPDIQEYSRLADLESELQEARQQLSQANRNWTPPHQLQQWLQLTHELELRHYNAKKLAAECQLAGAKDGCERLRKKRQTFMGSFRVAHGSAIDDVDQRIVQAKAALSEVTRDLSERLFRWRQIEQLCGFSIVNNQGLDQLQTSLLANHLMSNTSSLTRTNSEGTINESEPDSI